MGVKLSNYQVRKLLAGIIGDNGVAVLRACDSKKGVDDNYIAEKTGLKLNTIRSVLNQLHYNGLIRYNKRKDDNSNWYHYTWFARKDKINEVISGKWGDELNKLQEKLDYESNYVFYQCTNGCEKLPFELAAEYDFKCPECGEEVQNVDNKKTVRGISSEIREIKGLMKSLN